MSQEKLNNRSASAPIALVGGGSGGHIFPLVAVAEELVALGRPFYFIGTDSGLEKKIVGQLNWPYHSIQAGKWRRYLTLKSFGQNLLDIFRNFYGLFQALRILSKTKASVVFSKGGYVSLPVVYAAKLLGKKIIVHESDAAMGLTNRLSAIFADSVLTAFEVGTYPHANSRYRQVGIPIRKSLRLAAKLKAPKKTRPIILILPGSQGSLAINRLVKEKLSELLQLGDIIHLTGQNEFPIFRSLQENLPSKDQSSYKPYAFIDRELPYYFQAADLLIARASATTIAEAALFMRASYLIPLPSSASNHQVINAQLLEKAKAAFIRQEYQLSPDQFISDIKSLLNDNKKLQQLGQNLYNYFNADQTLEAVMKEING